MGERVVNFGIPSERVAALISAIMHGQQPQGGAPVAPMAPQRAAHTDAPEPLPSTRAPIRGSLGIFSPGTTQAPGNPQRAPGPRGGRGGVVEWALGRFGQGPGGAYPTSMRNTVNGVLGGGLAQGPGGGVPMGLRLGTGAALIPGLNIDAPSVIRAPAQSVTQGGCGPGG